MRRLVGLSVSFCVRDLARGKVQYAEILAIVGGTKIRDESDKRDLIEHYRRTYWSDFQDTPMARDQASRCVGYFLDLMGDGLILQPRLQDDTEDGFNPSCLMSQYGQWIEVL